MSLPQGPRFPSFADARTPAMPKGPPVLGVGSRVLVMARGSGSGVRLMDAAGTNAIATVADGAEVEILAWHPRRGGETRYRVVQTTGGVEGWIGATSLKPRPAPVAPTPIRVAPVSSARPTPSAVRAKPVAHAKPAAAPRVRRPPVAAKARKGKR